MADPEFRILGPLEASIGGRPVPLGGRRQQAVLAILLAHANEVVPAERLIDGVWADEPPESAVNLVQGYVSAMRKALGRETIATRGRGYTVVVGAGALDLDAFERGASAAAAQEAGSPQESARLLGEALALWRGPALADLADLPGVRPLAARLDELRLVALERRAEAELECGREAEVAAELEALIAQHPLRERLRALRMLALYRSGRQADALEEFRSARALLTEELGIEPSAELHALETAILRQESGLARPASPAAPGGDRPLRRRAVLGAALAVESLAALAGLGEALVRESPRELVLVATVARADALEAATGRLRGLREELSARGVSARVGAFTSLAPGADLARTAVEQDVELVLVDAPAGLLEDARLIALLDDAPCDVAVVVGDGTLRPGPVLVPFSGAEHDWAAMEVGASLAHALPRPLSLAGASTGAGGRDASRLLASASLALQRVVGVQADPVIVDPSPAALAALARDAGLVVVGLTERWRREGLGRARTALATAPGVTTLLVRRGLRPGGLAGRADETRFTWTLAAAAA